MPFNTPYQALNNILNFAEQEMPDSISEVNDARLKALVQRIKNGESVSKVVADVRKFIIGQEAIQQWAMDQGIGEDLAPQVANDLISGKVSFQNVQSGEYGMGSGASTEALPQGAKLVRIGKNYRVVWNLGDGMGWAWYSIDRENLKRLFNTATPDAHLELSSNSQFDQRFGKNFWGDISEVNLGAATPWEDLKEKIFSQFGWVPGLDDPEVRRTILQGYFEGWNETQFTVEYRKTKYFNSLTDTQREWVSLSKAERAQRIQEVAVRMAESYRSIWGESININDPIIKDAATKVASGAELMDKWLYDQRREARTTEGTPAYNEGLREENKEQNQAENLGLYAEQQYREWVGPGALPKDFGKKWGNWLNSGLKSEADLENYLKSISQSKWQYKPPDVTWQDWASPFKSQIQQTLELPSLSDTDPLLSRVLNSNSEENGGIDVNRTIRRDPRFRKTQGLYNELSQAASELGKQFGFIG